MDYYRNKQVASLWNFKDGKLNGKASYYDVEGNLRQEASFKDNMLDGKTCLYDKKGVLKESATFRKGNLMGDVRRFAIPKSKIFYGTGDLLMKDFEPLEILEKKE